MSSDSVRPSSFSLRTSRLNVIVSRLSSCASSGRAGRGAAVDGCEGRAGPRAVGGPVEAVKAADEARVLLVREVGLLAHGDPRVGAGEAQADAKDGTLRVARESGEQLLARGRTGSASLRVADRLDRDHGDRGRLDEPDRRAHPCPDP